MSDNYDLDNLGIAELRKLASTVYRLPLTRDMTADDIRKLIKSKEKKGDFAQLAEFNGDAPRPGWARVIIHKDNNPSSSNRPVYLSINGYRITIPRGVEVDVPIKVVGVLNDAKQRFLKENTSVGTGDPNRFFWEDSHSYPFSVVNMTSGPDPKPGNEKNREKQMGPRIRFRDKFGYWPKREELREAMRRGELDDIILKG
jgi:hypothetical protein